MSLEASDVIGSDEEISAEHRWESLAVLIVIVVQAAARVESPANVTTLAAES